MAKLCINDKHPSEFHQPDKRIFSILHCVKEDCTTVDLQMAIKATFADLARKEVIETQTKKEEDRNAAGDHCNLICDL